MASFWGRMFILAKLFRTSNLLLMLQPYLLIDESKKRQGGM